MKHLVIITRKIIDAKNTVLFLWTWQCICALILCRTLHAFHPCAVVISISTTANVQILTISKTSVTALPVVDKCLDCNYAMCMLHYVERVTTCKRVFVSSLFFFSSSSPSCIRIYRCAYVCFGYCLCHHIIYVLGSCSFASIWNCLVFYFSLFSLHCFNNQHLEMRMHAMYTYIYVHFRLQQRKREGDNVGKEMHANQTASQLARQSPMWRCYKNGC